MIVSTKLTTGELSFLFNVSRQIFAYGGSFLIGLVILASVPRLALVDTHDTVNQIVGGSTATFSKIRWILNRVRRNTTNLDPTPPDALFLILTLSIIYNLFLSLSDVAHIGIHSCAVSNQPGGLQSPASLNSEDKARSSMTANLVQGNNLTGVKAWRCDSSSLLPKNQYNCTSWNHSTYADPAFFTNINSTDSEVFLLRQLSSSSLCSNVNSFRLGPDIQRLAHPINSNGIAINPKPMGVQIIAGVPDLSPGENVEISQTMAVEVEVGCMSLGFKSVRLAEKSGGNDFMVVGSTNQWDDFAGPHYLQDVLLHSANATRAYLRPFFNESTLSNGTVKSFNPSSASFSRAAHVIQFHLPDRTKETSLLADCTTNLQKKLDLTSSGRNNTVPMCGYFGVGGSVAWEGKVQFGFVGMICASTTQVNMVNSSISVSLGNQVNITSVSPISSTLNYLRADDYIGQCSNRDSEASFLPYERYTLTQSANGSKSHFISPSAAPPLSDVTEGTGSGGSFISTLNSFFFTDFSNYPAYAGLRFLAKGLTPLSDSDIAPAMVTKWMGQIAASIASVSITYNGWAALQVPRMLVVRTKPTATCYDTRYALSLIPLALVMIVVLIIAVTLLLQRSFFGSAYVKKAYGGLFSQAIPEGMLLVWEQDAQGTHPRLQAVEKGYIITGHPNDTALQFFKPRH